jgi:hypothetical protein
VKPFFYFINNLLIKYEIPLVVLSFLGILSAIVKKDRHGIFLSYWTLGIIGVYSLAPYKTPWCVINLILPMALLSGYAVQSWADWITTTDAGADTRTVLGFSTVVLMGLVAIPLSQTLRIVYKEFDYDRYEMIYGHTSRDVFNLINTIDDVAERSEEKKNIRIHVATREYWPIPFYLRNYTNMFFWDNLNTTELDANILIADQKQREELNYRLKNSYEIKTFTLRPGVPVLLYINRALAETAGLTPAKIPSPLRGQQPAGNLKPGLLKEVFSGADFKGKSLSRRSGAYDFDFWHENEAEKEWPSPFCVRWSGYVKVETPGAYTYVVESDDGAELRLDDILVVDNSGEHALRRISNNVTLTAGYHKFELRYFDIGGQAILKLMRGRDGHKLEPISDDQLFSN